MSQVRWGALSTFVLISLVASAFAQEEKRLIRVGREDAAFLQKEKGWQPSEENPDTSLFSLPMADVEELSHLLHEKRGRCGGFKDVTQGELQFPVRPFVAPRTLLNHLDQALEQILQTVREDDLLQFIATLSRFPTRRYDSPYGKNATEWVAQQLQSLANGRSDLTVELIDHQRENARWVMPSLIARLKGAVRPEESVIVGGHLDSINGFSSGAAAPGADDDASGVAAAYSAFQAIVASGVRPARTLEFIAYSAEEVGLWGSQAIARSYRAQNRAVQAVMQLDMVAYPGSGEGIYLLTDYVDLNLNRMLRAMAEGELGLKIGLTKCGYGCSDHVSWTDAGYPAVIPFEAKTGEDNPQIHTSRDTLENSLSMKHALKFAYLATTFYWDLGVKP